MNWPQLISASIVLGAVAVFIYTSKTPTEQSVYEAARASVETQYGIQFGPIRHSELPSTLIERIRRLEEVFAEVYPITHQEWLDGFQRDQNPESEVAFWEHMATAYTQFLRENDIALAARGEAFGLLLMGSGTSDVESQLSNLNFLTIEEGRRLISLYHEAPRPITYTEQ